MHSWSHQHGSCHQECLGRYKEGDKMTSELEAQNPAVAKPDFISRLRETESSALRDCSNSGVSPWLHGGIDNFSTSVLSGLDTLRSLPHSWKFLGEGISPPTLLYLTTGNEVSPGPRPAPVWSLRLPPPPMLALRSQTTLSRTGS